MKKSFEKFAGKEVKNLKEIFGGNGGAVRIITKGPNGTTVIVFGDLAP